MPLTEKGEKIMKSMKRTYGGKKGEQVFYATANSGKIKGVEKKEELKKGRVPLQTLRADIDFARVEANLPYGVIGIKVWIYRGQVFEDRKAGQADTAKRSNDRNAK